MTMMDPTGYSRKSVKLFFVEDNYCDSTISRYNLYIFVSFFFSPPLSFLMALPFLFFSWLFALNFFSFIFLLFYYLRFFSFFLFFFKSFLFFFFFTLSGCAYH